jgi:hypothetical protein
MKVNRRLRNVKGADMKIFQTPSYDRFCLFEMERKSKDFRGMDDNVAYKNKQIDNVEISNEGRRALREKLREVKPKVEEPIGYELTIQDTTNMKKNTAEQKEYIDTAVSMMEKAQKRFLEMREEPKYTAGIAKSVIWDIMSNDNNFMETTQRLFAKTIYHNA